MARVTRRSASLPLRVLSALGPALRLAEIERAPASLRGAMPLDSRRPWASLNDNPRGHHAQDEDESAPLQANPAWIRWSGRKSVSGEMFEPIGIFGVKLARYGTT